MVHDGDRSVAVVEASRTRRRLRVSGFRASTSGSTPLPDPAAWPRSSAERAARGRWRDLHPRLVTITAISLTEKTITDPAAVLTASGSVLADLGFRRMDVRVHTGHPVVDALQRAGWATGRLGDDVVASTPLRYPWDLAEPAPIGDTSLADRLPRWLPLRVRRLGRRLLAVHLRRIPELVHIAITEGIAAARTRQVYRGARAARSHEAPDHAFPFAVSRYRTIRETLSRVDVGMRSTALLDVGSGDGRVLAEALAIGFPQVIGREVDSELAARSQALLGARGRVDVGDALASPIPAEVGVVYLNNPFDSPAVERLAELVSASLAAHPRPLLVIYINPRTIRPWVDAGFVLVDVAPQFTVFVTGLS